MELPSPFWSDLNTDQFSEIARNPNNTKLVAVLPIASTEQHGAYLPVNVNSVLIDGIINLALRNMSWIGSLASSVSKFVPVLILPTQKISLSAKHINFAGTLALAPQTAMALWLDIGASVARTGIKKLVLFNSGSDNIDLMTTVAHELNEKHKLIVFQTSWYDLPLLDVNTGESLTNLFCMPDHDNDNHAGEIKTSITLSLRRDLVKIARPENCNATADKGSRLTHAAGLALAKFLEEVSNRPVSTRHD